MQPKWARIIAAAAAFVGWAGLVLQLALLVGSMGLAAGLWRFLGFFTILTNLGAAAVATAVALGRTGGLGSQRARLMAATAMLIVGIVYSVALRALWNPTGLRKVADVALHDATPLLWLMLWLFARGRRIEWREVGWALAWPLLYAIYALLRGAIDGWYAYWFLNPAEQGLPELAASVAVMLCGFALIAAALIAIQRRIAPRPPAPRRPKENSVVDEAGMESFPASDPPGWTLGDEREPQ